MRHLKRRILFFFVGIAIIMNVTIVFTRHALAITPHNKNNNTVFPTAMFEPRVFPTPPTPPTPVATPTGIIPSLSNPQTVPLTGLSLPSVFIRLVPTDMPIETPATAVAIPEAIQEPPTPTPTPPMMPQQASQRTTAVTTTMHRSTHTAMTPLLHELEDMVAGWYGEHAIGVMDLHTGEMISVNGARPQPAGCTIKIGIIIAVAQDIEQGLYTTADVAPLVQAMMGPSNTPPARMLLAKVGGGDVGAGIRRVNQIMWGAGSIGSILTHPPGYPWEEYGYYQSLNINENLLTADDMLRLLSKLYAGELLSPAMTRYVLDTMTIAPAWMNSSFGVALPPDATLYHKVGQIYQPHNTWNDAGIVAFERNGVSYAYALVYLGSYSASWSVSYAYAQQVSYRAWHYFSTTYGG